MARIPFISSDKNKLFITCQLQFDTLIEILNLSIPELECFEIAANFLYKVCTFFHCLYLKCCHILKNGRIEHQTCDQQTFRETHGYHHHNRRTNMFEHRQTDPPMSKHLMARHRRLKKFTVVALNLASLGAGCEGICLV